MLKWCFALLSDRTHARNLSGAMNGMNGFCILMPSKSHAAHTGPYLNFACWLKEGMHNGSSSGDDACGIQGLEMLLIRRVFNSCRTQRMSDKLESCWMMRSFFYISYHVSVSSEDLLNKRSRKSHD